MNYEPTQEEIDEMIIEFAKRDLEQQGEENVQTESR